MGLDISLKVVQPVSVFDANITHNLGSMAKEAGIYQILWHPDEVGITNARQLIEPLAKAIELMRSNPDHFKSLDSPNGWGTYKDFLPWLMRLLAACVENPEASIRVSR